MASTAEDLEIWEDYKKIRNNSDVQPSKLHDSADPPEQIWYIFIKIQQHRQKKSI